MNNQEVEKLLNGFQQDFDALFKKANEIKQSRIIEQNNLEHINKELETLKEEVEKYNCDFDNIEETISNTVNEIQSLLRKAQDIMNGNVEDKQEEENVDLNSIEI